MSGYSIFMPIGRFISDLKLTFETFYIPAIDCHLIFAIDASF
jgi:hypothetical protein